MTIQFADRPTFERALHHIFDHNVRCNSAGNLDIKYADMLIVFEDKGHAHRAVTSLKTAKIIHRVS